MWPVYLLLNKILKTEEEGEEKVFESDGDHMSVAECCPFHISSNHGTGCNAVMPSSCFLEVSSL